MEKGEKDLSARGEREREREMRVEEDMRERYERDMERKSAAVGPLVRHVFIVERTQELLFKAMGGFTNRDGTEKMGRGGQRWGLRG